MSEIYYTVGRPINGISLNGNEWLQDDQGRLRLFKGKATAKAYLKREINVFFEAVGETISDDELEDNFVFEVAEPDEIVNGVITTV